MNTSTFFQNTDCQYFPCHSGIDPEHFNCLFCYCPLYALGRDCGGNFRYTDRGVKVCTDCNFVHLDQNYGKVLEKVRKLVSRLAHSELESR